MKKIKLYLILSLAIFIKACSPVYYVPNTANIPLFKEKNEIQVSGYIGATEHTDNLGVNAAYSISNNIGIMVNAHYYDGGDDASAQYQYDPSIINRDYNPKRFAQMIEAGVGFFKPISRDSSIIFETYVGAGYYDANVALNSAQSISYSINRLFIQPSLGYRHKYVEIAFGVRIAQISFNRVIPSTVFLETTEPMERFNSLDNKTLVEPSISVRAGSETVKLQLQFIGATVINSSEVSPIDGGLISLGIHFKF
jgi:hypothetical protein